MDEFRTVFVYFCHTTMIHLLTYSIVQSHSWEANWFAASQEIPRILWNPKVHYRTHKPPPPVHACKCFVTISFLLCGVVSLTPNPQPGGPGYPFLSGSSHLTCLAWEALPVAYAIASIALGIMWPRKPHHYVKVGIPMGFTMELNVRMEL
jgi:hypothetical protein